MPTHRVVLTDHQESLIARLVREGRYQSASDVLEAGLRLVEQAETAHSARIEAFREAALAGIASIERGEFHEFATVEELRAWIDELGEAVIAELPVRG